MGKFLSEFKEFAVKGNAVDMAVGVIIGGAFGKIVGGVNFSDLKVTLPSEKIADGIEMHAATINYGNFVQNLIDFVIIAFCVFLLVKVINKVAHSKKEAPAPVPAHEPSAEEKLLTEIRDLMKSQKQG